MTQRQACRYALRRAAERRQPQNRSGGTDSNDDGTPMEEIDEPQQLFEPASDVPMDPSGSFEPEPNNTSRRAYVEEVDDEESGGSARYVEDYLGNAGKTKGHSQNYFERWREAQRDKNFKPWVPFSDIEEWELAQWLIMNVGQNATDKFLKLPIVSQSIKESRREAYNVNRHVIAPNCLLRTSVRSISASIHFHMEQNGNANLSR